MAAAAWGRKDGLHSAEYLENYRPSVDPNMPNNVEENHFLATFPMQHAIKAFRASILCPPRGLPFGAPSQRAEARKKYNELPTNTTNPPSHHILLDTAANVQGRSSFNIYEFSPRLKPKSSKEKQGGFASWDSSHNISLNKVYISELTSVLKASGGS